MDGWTLCGSETKKPRAIGQKGRNRTAKTDETPVFRLSSVSSVGLGATFTSTERLSSVLAVPPPAVLETQKLETKKPRGDVRRGFRLNRLKAAIHR